MKSAPFEIEVKRLLVGENSLDKLITTLGVEVSSSRRQINYIFDTEDRRLDRARYALRLRTENSNAFLAAKGPSRHLSGSTNTKAEAEVSLEASEVDAVLQGLTDPLSLLHARATDPAFAALWSGLDEARGRRPLKCWGRFETLRRTVPVTLPEGWAIQVEFDTTTFPDNRIDHEVEVELPTESAAGRVEEWLEAAALAAGVETKDSTPKIVRFFASIQGGAA
jgi:uncharacterized protein YjbK